jgi:2',3'-cyclic-nucleotide 2'-phosphodiesterase (5'-nucleotidase family)
MVHAQDEELCDDGNIDCFAGTSFDVNFDEISTDEPLPLNDFSNVFPAAVIILPAFATKPAIATPLTQTAAQSCDVNALVAQVKAEMEECMKEEITKAKEDMERKRDADKEKHELQKKEMEERHHTAMAKVTHKNISHCLFLFHTPHAS